MEQRIELSIQPAQQALLDALKTYQDQLLVSLQTNKNFSKENLNTIFVTWFLTFFLFFFCGSFLTKFSSQGLQRNLDSHLSKVSVPAGKPPITQESIDKAVQMFAIKIPRNAMNPELDLLLKDRGVTIRSLISEKAIVKIGPNAFKSWALLGSTLAHEVEIHCVQNYGSVFLMDVLGFDGVTYAEVQAYDYELSNASRFGLSLSEIDSIFETKNDYVLGEGKLSLERITKYTTLSESFFTSFFSRD